MFGFPGENEDDLNKTENMVLNEPFHKVSIAPCIPLPGTQIYKNLVERSEIIEKTNWDNFSLYGNSIFATDHFHEQRLRRFMRRIHLRFYLRLKIVIGILLELHSFRQAWAAFRIFFYRLGLEKTKWKKRG